MLNMKISHLGQFYKWKIYMSHKQEIMKKERNNISGICELFTQTIPLPIAWFWNSQNNAIPIGSEVGSTILFQFLFVGKKLLAEHCALHSELGSPLTFDTLYIKSIL